MQVRPLVEDDFEILEVMSGRSKWLWYITGAYIAQVIDAVRNPLFSTGVEFHQSAESVLPELGQPDFTPSADIQQIGMFDIVLFPDPEALTELSV
ncbi:MAG: hypothetical protein ACTSYL_04520 [Candidatus Thorarchaeota archaeon]